MFNLFRRKSKIPCVVCNETENTSHIVIRPVITKLGFFISFSGGPMATPMIGSDWVVCSDCRRELFELVQDNSKIIEENLKQVILIRKGKGIF